MLENAIDSSSGGRKKIVEKIRKELKSHLKSNDIENAAVKVFAFVGGMGFAHMLASYQDLTAVILAHWFFTFLNTPTPPAGDRQG